MHGCAYARAYENYRERHITMDCYLITVWLLLLVWLCDYGQCYIQDFYTIIKWDCILPLTEVQVLRTLNHFPEISVPISKTVLWGVSCPSKEEGWWDGPTLESRAWQPCAQLSLQCMRAWYIDSVMSDTVRPYGLKHARILCPWDSPGKNTWVGCHALIQIIFLAWESNPHLLGLLHWQIHYLCTIWEAQLSLQTFIKISLPVGEWT